MNRENGLKMFKVRYFFLFKGSGWHDLRVRISSKKNDENVFNKKKIQDYYPIKIFNTWLNINLTTVHNNTL